MELNISYDDIQHFLSRIPDIKASIIEHLEDDATQFMTISKHISGSGDYDKIDRILSSYCGQAQEKKAEISKALNQLYEFLTKIVDEYVQNTQEAVESLEVDLTQMADNK